MKFKQIKETCIYVNDLEQCKDFYEGILGLGLISYVPGKHVFFQVGKCVLLCFNPKDSMSKNSPPAHFGGGKQHFALEVSKSDYPDAKKEIISKGIKVIDEVTWQSGEKSFYFNDPEGNVLEIVPDRGIWD